MQKVTCTESMPDIAHSEYLFEGENRRRRGHAWLMLIEAMFVPSTVKVLFSTYLTCEIVTIVVVPTYPRVNHLP